MADPVLACRGITKSFGAVTASRDVTLDLAAGEIHALIGPNGAGKSTLIQQITGELAPDAGSIAIAGQDVTALGAPQRARLGLGRTFQISSLLMEDTVLENATLAALGHRGGAFSFVRPVMRDGGLRATASAALETVGLTEYARIPAAELSHGQRRQLELAMALALSPKVFLMDEPMAGLSAEGARQLTAILDRLRHQAPILLVEHDMDVVFALADRISVLVDGAIVASGSPDGIRSNPLVRQAYLGDEALP